MEKELRLSTVCGFGFRAFNGFPMAVASALALDDLATMKQTVDQRDNTRRAWEDLAPLREGLVRCDNDELLGFVSTGYHAAQQVCVVSVVG